MKKAAILTGLLSLSLSATALAELSHLDLKDLQAIIEPQFQNLSPWFGFNLLKKSTLENIYLYGDDADKTVRLIQQLFQSTGTTFGIRRNKGNPTLYLSNKTLGKILNYLYPLKESDLKSESLLHRTEAMTQVIWNDLHIPNTKLPFTKTRVRLFVELLFDAKLESLGERPKYLDHFPEQILLSFFWTKNNNRLEILELFREVPGILNATPQGWTDDQFKVAQYTSWKDQLDKKSPEALSKELLQSPELASFLAYSYDVYDHPIPPLIGPGYAAHSSLVNEKYPDCGETSVRNFFNIVLKDGDHFDAKILKQLPHKDINLTAKKELVEFYETYNEPSQIGQDLLRNWWSQKVVSGLKNVKYLQPALLDEGARVCEMDAGVNNGLTALGRLIFKSEAPYYKLKASEKLDEISRIFTRDGFRLTWSLTDGAEPNEVNNRDTSAEIKFSVNNTPYFIWKFEPRHFSIINSLPPENDWRRALEHPLSKIIYTSGKAITPLQLQLLSWFSGETGSPAWKEIVEELSHTQSKAAFRQFILSVPMKNVDDRLPVIDQLFGRKNSDFLTIAQNLIKSLPSDDLYAQSSVLESALKHQVPFLPELEATYFKAFSSDEGKRDSLFTAVQNSHLRLLKILAERGADLNIQSEGTDPLHYAIHYNNFEMIQILLEHAVNINSKDINGDTPLHIAVQWNRLPIVKLLMEHHARLETNFAGVTQLQLARRIKNGEDIVHYLETQLDLEFKKKYKLRSDH